MTETSPFHEGEIAVQQLCGEENAAHRLGALIKPTVLPRALDFLRQQSVIWIGVQDDRNRSWAFPVFGSPGFVEPHEGALIEIDLKNQSALPAEWLDYLKPGKYVGCLAIDLSSRLRLRINGKILQVDAQQIQIEVQQSYPNCPKYIRRRIARESVQASKWQHVADGLTLTPQTEQIIRRADTAFVASAGPNGVDVSHRGGATGFIRLENANKIIVPDYKGNGLFNTLGNFKSNPQGGLLIVDFEQGYFLQLTGVVVLEFDKVIAGSLTGGTDRYWSMVVSQWHLYHLQNSIEWQSLEFSPYNPSV